MNLEKLYNVSKEDLIKQILNKIKILSQEELLELNGFLTCELYKISNNNEQIKGPFKNENREKNDIKTIINLLNELISILSNEKNKTKSKNKKKKYSISSKNSFDLYSSSDSDQKYSKSYKKNKSYYNIMAELNYDKKKTNKKKKEGQKKNLDDYIEKIDNENTKNSEQFLLGIQNNKIVSHKILNN